MLTYKTTSEAYLDALNRVWNNYQFRSSPRGLPVRETMNYSFMVLNPTSESLVTHDLERNKVIAEYTAKETELYDSCTNKVEDFAKASKFWNKIANPDGTVNSAYGYLIWKNPSHGNEYYEHNEDGTYLEYCRTPWQWCVHSLKVDKDTRQAILRFSLPEHFWVGNKDMVCTLHGVFMIRDDKLHLTINMRSNDLMLGLVYDLPWFVSLIDKMVDELKPTYPDLEKGTYTHIVHSLHIYEKDEAAILRMLGHE